MTNNKEQCTERFQYANPGELWLLPQSELENLDIRYKKVLDIVEQAYLGLRTGNSENPVKTIVEPVDHYSISYSMVGWEENTRTVGFKAVYEFDPLRSQNAYNFHSFIFLCDDTNGTPIALMDVVKLGPLRSSATSALMAKAACPQARTALVVGSGVQGQNALPMLLAALPELERLQVFGTYQKGLISVQNSLTSLYPDRKVEIVTDLAKASRNADIIIGASGLTATQEVSHSQMKPGAIAILLGYGIAADVLHKSDYRITTDAKQMLATSDDLRAKDGTLPDIDAELPDILLGLRPARNNETDVVFAYNSGMIVTDIALGKYIADLAFTENRGTRVKFW